MKNQSKLFLTFSLLLALTLGLATKVQARTLMEQSQSLDQDISSDCTGTCHVEVSQSASQEQHLGARDADNSDRHARFATRFHDTISNTDDAHATVAWNFRGGTCEVRYGEARTRNYPYSTSTACDNGQLTIGGLVRGRIYRFQVRQDNGSWSRSMIMTAW